MFFGCIQKMFRLRYLEMKFIGQWLQSVMFLSGRKYGGAPLASGYRLYLTPNTSEGGVPKERLPLGVLGTSTPTATTTRQPAQKRRGWRIRRGSGQRLPSKQKDNAPMRLHKDVKRGDNSAAAESCSH